MIDHYCFLGNFHNSKRKLEPMVDHFRNTSKVGERLIEYRVEEFSKLNISFLLHLINR